MTLPSSTSLCLCFQDIPLETKNFSKFLFFSFLNLKKKSSLHFVPFFMLIFLKRQTFFLCEMIVSGTFQMENRYSNAQCSVTSQEQFVDIGDSLIYFECEICTRCEEAWIVSSDANCSQCAKSIRVVTKSLLYPVVCIEHFVFVFLSWFVWSSTYPDEVKTYVEVHVAVVNRCPR